MIPIKEAVERLEALAPRMAAEEPTFSCPWCLDSGFSTHDRLVKGDPCQLARFCESCKVGLAAEAGYWAEKLRVDKRSRRRAGETIVGRWRKRIRIHEQGRALELRVDEIVQVSSAEEERAEGGR